MKYVAIFKKNVGRIFQLQWKIGYIIDKFLQYSVQCGLMRAWPKLNGDIITDVSKAERIFYRCPDFTRQCTERRSSIRKRQMSWTLSRNARDIDNQCLDIVDQWIIFSFHWEICQQCPEIDHRYLLFLYTCMQDPRLRTVYRQRKWPLLVPMRKIMALGRKKGPWV